MSTTQSDYSTAIQRLLKDIGYRYEPFPPYDTNFWGPFHTWVLYTLGPTSSWGSKQLAELEHASGGIIERAYPYSSNQLRLLYAKLTAIAILIDDSIEDDTIHTEILQFSHKLYRGEDQQNGMLALYHENMKELSDMFGSDTVLRGLATVPWINYIDACLMEKQIFTAEVRLNCSPSRTSCSRLPFIEQFLEITGIYRFGWVCTEIVSIGTTCMVSHSHRIDSPHYLRSKSGIAEAYAAAIFKATKDQYLPLTKFIKVLPDLTFYIEVINDLLSFHKEEIDGETYNLIHLRTRSLALSGVRGNGSAGEWTSNDTFGLLCDEIREATRRIDGLLRLDECERKARGEAGVSVDEVDVQIAKQWRGFRDGYISWHFECRRYKLEFMKRAVSGTI
ncbi:terpenoid synthase [Mycena capillaripes]|nr:terpenoid synthase [Mycena capillaripes]